MTLAERLRAAIQASDGLTSVVPNELLDEAALAVALLDVALVTLDQIEHTPRNAGARLSAKATLLFIETQLRNAGFWNNASLSGGRRPSA